VAFDAVTTTVFMSSPRALAAAPISNAMTPMYEKVFIYLSVSVGLPP